MDEDPAIADERAIEAVMLSLGTLERRLRQVDSDVDAHLAALEEQVARRLDANRMQISLLEDNMRAMQQRVEVELFRCFNALNGSGTMRVRAATRVLDACELSDSSGFLCALRIFAYQEHSFCNAYFADQHKGASRRECRRLAKLRYKVVNFALENTWEVVRRNTIQRQTYAEQLQLQQQQQVQKQIQPVPQQQPLMQQQPQHHSQLQADQQPQLSQQQQRSRQQLASPPPLAPPQQPQQFTSSTTVVSPSSSATTAAAPVASSSEACVSAPAPADVLIKPEAQALEQ